MSALADTMLGAGSPCLCCCEGCWGCVLVWHASTHESSFRSIRHHMLRPQIALISNLPALTMAHSASDLE